MSNQTSTADQLTINANSAPTGSMGQKLLISGNAMAMRLWDEQPGDGQDKSVSANNYETLGYVLEGRAEITVEDKTITVKPGMSWVIPEGTNHSYKILEHFRAVEATHPSARGDG
ncbi:MAG: cupin domain-containing protein [Cyanobacteria bacterium J06623_5]